MTGDTGSNQRDAGIALIGDQRRWGYGRQRAGQEPRHCGVK
jgi:hypothetical protein